MSSPPVVPRPLLALCAAVVLLAAASMYLDWLRRGELELVWRRLEELERPRPRRKSAPAPTPESEPAA